MKKFNFSNCFISSNYAYFKSIFKKYIKNKQSPDAEYRNPGIALLHPRSHLVILFFRLITD